MKKHTFYSEMAYIIGLFMLAFGTALMSRGGFGVSMVVAPAYVLHLKLSCYFSFFSFGFAEYLLQAVILIIMMLILKRVRVIYFLTFITTIIYGALLDLAMIILPQIASDRYALRIGVYITGIMLCTAAISLLFKTYLPPAAYEVFVKNVSQKLKISLFAFKTGFDISFCILAAVLSLFFFGKIQGVGIGTAICALIYGGLIALFTRFFEHFFTFKNAFNFKIFKESEGKQ
ncbi:MAG: hypothetical protein IKV81_07390 [Clostridia bacterium]|nr:hypothetical protein [Clostridia bacterium]